MAVELAEAVISLIPSAKGIAGKLASELGGSETTGAAEAAGEKASSGFASKFSGLGGKLGGALGIGAAVGVAGIGVAALNIGATFDEAFDAIRVKTGATGETLGGLQDSFKSVFASVPTDANSAAAAVGTLSQRLGLTGKPLEDLATQVLDLSHVTGTDLQGNLDAVSGVFAGFGVAAAEQGPKLDELFRVSQATGVPVAQLASTMSGSGAVLRSVGLDYEHSAALIGTLGKAGLDAGEVMPALSKSMATAAKDGKDASTVLGDTFNAIKNAPDDTAAASAAMDVFGAKAGPKMAALVREGKLSYEDLAKSMATGGDTIKGAAEDTADFPEKLALLGNQAKLAFEPLATQVLSLATTMSEKLGPILAFVTDHMNILGPIIIGVAGAFAAYKVATTVASAATKIYTGIQAAFNLVMDANPIVLVVLGIAALAAGFYLAYTKIKPFHDLVNLVAGAVKTFVTGAIDFLVDHWKLMLAILTGPLGVAIALVIGHFQQIKDAIAGAAKWVGDKIGDILGFFTELPGKVLGAITGFPTLLLSKGTELIQGLLNGIESLVGTLTGWFTGLAGKVLGWIGNAALWLIDKGFDAVMGIVTGLGNAEINLINWLGGLAGKVLSWAGNALLWLIDTGKNVIQGLIDGVTSFFETGFKTAINIGKWVIDHVGDGTKILIGVGEDIVRGLRDGIVNGWHWVTDKVSELVGKIPGPIKSLLGIGSPSRVFAEIGRNVTEGLAVGLDSGIPSIANRMTGLAGMVAATPLGLNADLSVGGTAIGGPGGVLGGHTITQNFHGQMSPREVAGELAWTLKTAGR